MSATHGATITSNAVLLGEGRLTWNPDERRTDRYGYIKLLPYGDSLTEEPIDSIALSKDHNGQKGSLVCKVVETRASSHIGDLFHGVFPRTPKVGDEITLGSGTLDFQNDTVGLLPDDGRITMWLSMRALYDCQEQTVALYFVPQEVS